MKNNLIAPTIVLAIAASTSHAISTPHSTLAENKVVVTANRMEQDMTSVLADVEVIERKDIERLQAQSFVDLLVNIAGIDTVKKGSQGQDSSIFSRGTNSNQVLVLIDGIRVGSATLGVKSVSNISISQIERIEIVKGPRAALWGSDAIGGVIQVFTRRYEAGEHKVAVTFGSNETREVEAAIGFGSKAFSNTLTYSHKETDGFDIRIDGESDKDGYENDSLALRGDYQINENAVLDWVAQADQGEGEFDTTFGGNVIKHDNYHWNIRYTNQTNDWNNQVAIKNSRDHSDTSITGFANVFETRREQVTFLTRNKVSESLSVGGGIEWYEDNVGNSSTQFSRVKRNTGSAHTSVNYIGEALIVDFALRYDDVQNVSSETTLNFGMGYKFDAQNLLSLNFGEGFKAPTFNDLYFPFGGNPDLHFETSDNLELVYKGFYNIGSLVISLYDSEIDNLIQWIPDSNGVWSPQNIGKAEVTGIDASFKIHYGSYAHKITASYVEAEDTSSGEQLLRRAKEHFGYEVSHAGDSFDWFALVQYVGERPENDFQTFQPVMLDSHVRLDLGISYTFTNNWRLKLKVNDVFNEAPTTVSGFHPLEREFYLTVVHQNLF